MSTWNADNTASLRGLYDKRALRIMLSALLQVIFGIMNEPSNLGNDGTELWLRVCNSAIAAIRDTGAENLLLVPGAIRCRVFLALYPLADHPGGCDLFSGVRTAT